MDYTHIDDTAREMMERDDLRPYYFITTIQGSVTGSTLMVYERFIPEGDWWCRQYKMINTDLMSWKNKGKISGSRKMVDWYVKHELNGIPYNELVVIYGLKKVWLD